MEKSSNGHDERSDIDYQSSAMAMGTDRISCLSSCTAECPTKSKSMRGAAAMWRKENVMRLVAACLFSGAVLMSATAAGAQEIDWQKVDSAFGRKSAIVSGDVHRYSFPRTDLIVSLDGVTIKPALALGGWVAFKPMHAERVARSTSGEAWRWAISCCWKARLIRS